MDSKIHVQLEGSGYNIWLLFITPEIYERLKVNAENNFPESAFDILEDENLMADATLASLGLDTYIGFTGRIVSNSDELKINGAVNTYEDYALEDIVRDEEIVGVDNLIECNLKNAKKFGDGLSLPHDSLIVIDITEIGNCTLDAWLDDDGKELNIRKFQLLTVDLDSCNEYSEATYTLGVLKGMERDIRGISYGDQEAGFELSIIKGYRDLILVRNRNGRWEIDENSDVYLAQ